MKKIIFLIGVLSILSNQIYSAKSERITKKKIYTTEELLKDEKLTNKIMDECKDMSKADRDKSTNCARADHAHELLFKKKLNELHDQLDEDRDKYWKDIEKTLNF